MIRYAIPLFAATAIAAPASAAEIQIQSSGPVVELSVMEQVEAEPDLVTVSAGVTTQAPTAVEALRQNSMQMRQVIDRLRSLGVPEQSIQTVGINLNARYDYDRDTQQQIFRGYQASNRVSIELREIEGTGEVLDALVQAGATDLSGPTFTLEDDEAAKAEARRNAMERARSQAMDYARMAGYSDIRLLQVSEAIAGRGPMPVARMAAMGASGASAPPVQPGLVAAAVTVTVTYEMAR